MYPDQSQSPSDFYGPWDTWSKIAVRGSVEFVRKFRTAPESPASPGKKKGVPRGGRAAWPSRQRPAASRERKTTHRRP